ncbi:MAG: hypothetical protein JNK23_04605 [Opitutaceae bacterium]|nr:hypothetical protein [Opitutaceae bacterium]
MTTTVLLCGTAWWLPQRPEPVTFAYREAAAAVLVGALAGDGPRRLRLIYHPEGFASTATPCPHVPRRTLGLALQEQFPGLDTEDLAWSHEPILRIGEGFATVIHRESDPWLVGLVAQLATAGIEIESAWPLATWLSALPEEWSESGGTTVLAVIGDQACAYRHAAGGVRHVEQWPGAASGAPEAWLRDILARETDEPVLVVTANAPSIERFASAGQTTVQRHLPLPEALTWAATLPRKHPAQLLPEPPLFTPNRAAFAASVALLALGAASFAPWMRAHLAAPADVAALRAREGVLRAEIAHLRANATEIDALRAGLAQRTAPFAGPLLRRIAATVPPEITLTVLEATPDAVEARGYVAPGAPEGALERWRTLLSPPGTALLFHAETPANRAAPFRLRGNSVP